jgi:PKD repeat protein
MKGRLLRNGLVFGMIFVLVCMAFSIMPMNVACEDANEPTEPVPLGGVEDYRLDYDGVVTEWIEQEIDTATGTSYMLHENHGGWWADAEKAPGSDGKGNPAPDNPGDEDDLLCWAATVSNMLEWTGWGYVGGMENGNTDDFFDYFIDHTTDYGSLNPYGIEWWFTGNLPTHSGDWSTEDVAGGDFWSSSYTWTTYSDESAGGSAVLPDIKSYLTSGYAVGLAIYPITPPGGHAITCWGVNYDTTKNPATEPEDYYLGVWVSDSDSHKGSADPDDYLRYFEVEWDSTNSYWYMPNYGSGWKISAVTSLHPFPGESRPVADAGGPYVVGEGTTVSFSASGTSDPDSDPLKYRWDYDGDGDWDTSWSSSSSGSHTWEDDYSGDVYLEVFDGRLRDVDMTTVTVNNVAPTLTSSGDTISENGIATVSGFIADPSSEDTFELIIDWGEGSPKTYNYPAGTTSYSETHQYLDDDPTGTASDVYTIDLSVTDDDGGSDTDSTSVTVNNLSPVVSANGDTINEHGIASVSGSISDTGSLDTFKLEINWGEGSPETFNYPAGTTSYSETHQYLDDNPTATLFDVYTITVTLTDDDTESDVDTTTVTVNNVDPVTSIDSMAQPNPQFILPLVHTLDFSGSFTDTGTQDTHTAIWDWGDTTMSSGTVVESGGSGTVTGSHIYTAPGIYTVTLTVTDDDGGSDSDTFVVEVVDAHGALDDLNDYIQGLSDDDFKNQAKQRKDTLENKIDVIHSDVDKENYKGAIQKLKYDIRDKADGQVDGQANNDWITDKTAQEEICMKIDDIIAYLKTFM